MSELSRHIEGGYDETGAKPEKNLDAINKLPLRIRAARFIAASMVPISAISLNSTASAEIVESTSVPASIDTTEQYEFSYLRSNERDGEQESFTNTERINGADRVETAIEISRATEEMLVAKDEIITGVFLVRADKFPDAYAASAIVYTGSPHDGRKVILMTESGNLNDKVLDRILELRNRFPMANGFPVTLLGGENALSNSIREELGQHAQIKTGRLHGENRAATAVEIMSRHNYNRILIAPGWNDEFTTLFASASNAHKLDYDGVTHNGALLFSHRDPNTGKAFLPQETLDMLNNSGIDIVAVGSEAIEAVRNTRPQIRYERNFIEIGGKDHFEIAFNLAEFIVSHKPGNTVDAITTVRGEDTAADTVTGIPHAADMGLLFPTPVRSLHPNIPKAIERWGVAQGLIFGGPNAVSSDVATRFDDLLRAQDS